MNTSPRHSPDETNARLRLGLLILITALLLGAFVVEILPRRQAEPAAAYQSLPVSIQAAGEADYSRGKQALEFQPVDLGILESIQRDRGIGLPESASLEELRSALQSPIPTTTPVPGQATQKAVTGAEQPARTPTATLTPTQKLTETPTRTALPTETATATLLPPLTATSGITTIPWSPTSSPTPKKPRPPADTEPAPEPTQPPRDTPAPPPTTIPSTPEAPRPTQKATDVGTEEPPPPATQAPKPTSAPTPTPVKP